MKRDILNFLFLVTLTIAQQPWKLVWKDEFNGNSLNQTNWENEVDCWGGGNGELQCYTARAQNVKVESGNLVITAKPERYTGVLAGCTNNAGGTCTATKDYTSARMHSRAVNGASWLYGRWEIRAKLPKGKHLWPALWMIPTDNKYGSWAASGEIDIMEYRGQIPNKVEGTLHFGGAFPNNIYQGSGPTTFPSDLSQDFHIYAVEWEKDEIRWFVDNQKYHTMSLVRSFFSGKGTTNPYTAVRQPFDQRFHFIINLAVGGGFFPAGTYGTLTAADVAQWTSSSLFVDYVRVYQRDGSQGTVPQTSVSTNPASSASKAPVASSLSKASTPSSSVSIDTSGSSISSFGIPKQTQIDLTSQDGSLDNNDANSENAEKSSVGLGMTPIITIAAASFFGILVIVVSVIVILVVVRRRRRSKLRSMTTDSDSPPTSMSSMPFSVSVLGPEIHNSDFRPKVGRVCRAKYSGDGKYYEVTIERLDGSRYLVNYGVQFDFETEWLDYSSLAP